MLRALQEHHDLLHSTGVSALIPSPALGSIVQVSGCRWCPSLTHTLGWLWIGHSIVMPCPFIHLWAIVEVAFRDVPCEPYVRAA